MRNMSFFMTTPQYRDRTKNVTRRLGWDNLKPGECFMGIVKGQGLKKGEKVEKLHPSRCLSNRREPVSAITQEDVVREGFPRWTPAEFVNFFCRGNKCSPDQIINRIKFEHLEWAG